VSRLPRKLALALAILAAGCLAAGCGSGSIKNALSSAAASRTSSFSPPTFSPPTLPTKTRPPAPTTAPAIPPPATPTTVPVTPATTAPATPTTGPASPPTTPAVSSQPAVTAPVAAPAPAPQSPAAASPSPVASQSGSSLLWLWILLGIIVIAVVIVAVLIARNSGRRSAAAASWRSKVVDVYAKGSALYDAMSIAEAPGAQAAGDASARWSDIQRRADDLGQELYALRETAPGEPERQRVADVLASLQVVRSAMDAERAPGPASPPQQARVPELLRSFEASLRTLRLPSEYGESP
jgi:hypothetical protein